MARLNVLGFIAILVVTILAGCATAPTETAVADVPPPTQPDTVEEVEPDVVEREKPEERTVEEDVRIIVPWLPPIDVAPPEPSHDERGAIAGWVAALPFSIRYDAFPSGAFPPVVWRRYVGAAFRTSVDALSGTTGFERIEGRVAMSVHQEASAKNVYGATDLEIAVRLAGSDRPVVTGVVRGPLVLSRVSAEDGQLSSLRSIDSETVERAVVEMRAELADIVSRRGVPFRVAETPAASDAAVYAALRSIGVPGDTDGTWLLHGTPRRVNVELRDIFDGSPYRVSVATRIREIRIVYEEGE